MAFLVEGTPYTLSDVNAISRQVTFGGQTFQIQDRIDSNANIEFASGGYQFDVVSRGNSYFAVQAAAAYVNATASLRSETYGFTGTETQSFAMPLAGVEGRIFARRLSLGGYARGMSLGSYGHYFQTGVDAGVDLGRYATILAGYELVDANIQSHNGTRGFAPRFYGPVFGFQFRR